MNPLVKQSVISRDAAAFKELFLGSYMNVLLFFVPAAFVSYYSKWSPIVVFTTNFLAMIPLASILGQSTEACAEHLGQLAGGLLNATFGNAVEIVIMVMALLQAKSYEYDHPRRDGLLTVVQTSLIGSVFSNSLLVLGAAMVANGFYFKEGQFNVSAVRANISLMMVAAFVMMLPGPFVRSSGGNGTDALWISRIASLILMGLYFALLYFQLFTHRSQLEEESNVIEQSRRMSMAKQRSVCIADNKYHVLGENQGKGVNGNAKKIGNGLIRDRDSDEKSKSFSPPDLLIKAHEANGHSHGAAQQQQKQMAAALASDDDFTTDDEEDDDVLDISMISAVTILLISTVLLSMHSDYLVDAIEPLAEKYGISEAFIGIILIPIVGNAVEQLTAIRVAMKNKMDISLSIAIGSATQVSMFAISSAVLVAWMMNLELTLAFDTFEQNILWSTSLIIYGVVSDGKCNWFRGTVLLALYCLIGVAVWNQNYHYYE